MLVGGGACDGHTSTVTVPILGSSVSEDTFSSVRREFLPVFLPWV